MDGGGRHILATEEGSGVACLVRLLLLLISGNERTGAKIIPLARSATGHVSAHSRLHLTASASGENGFVYISPQSVDLSNMPHYSSKVACVYTQRHNKRPLLFGIRVWSGLTRSRAWVGQLKSTRFVVWSSCFTDRWEEAKYRNPTN